MDRQKIQKNLPHILFILILSGLLLYGIKSYGDFGITYDDYYQRYHTLVTYNALFLQDETYVTESVNTAALPTLEQYGVSYGTLVQLPTIWWEHIHDFTLSLDEAIQSRHFYVFLWYLVSVVFFYFLGLRLFKKPWLALAGVCIYILHPRILADANYNVKDSLCMALFTISLYFGVRVIQRQTLWNTFLFLVFSALCTTTRIVGGEIIAVCLFVLFLKSLRNGTFKRFLLTLVIIGVLFLGIFVAMTPQAWSDPLGVVMRIIRTFSNYTTWVGDVKYFGVAVDGHHLPWHYLFVWIFITTPIVYQLLWGIGTLSSVLGFGFAVYRKKLRRFPLEQIFLFLVLVIPFIYVLVFNPTLYNGWRHFYFVYPCLVLWATYGLQRLLFLGGIWASRLAPALLAAAMLYTGFWIIANHPYEYVYFQPFVRSYAQKNFDLDYWALTEQAMYKYIDETDDRHDLLVESYSGHADQFSTNDTRFIEAESLETANYAMTPGEEFDLSFLYDKVYSIESDGAVLRDLWKKRYNILHSFEMRISPADSSIQYEAGGIEWSVSGAGEETIYTALLTEPIPADTLAITFADADILSLAKLYYTEDLSTWVSWSEDSSYTKAASTLSVRCESDTIRGIRLIFPSSMQSAASAFQLYFAGDYDRNSKMEHKGNLAVNAASSNEDRSSTPAYYATDNDPQTRWESETQRTGLYLQLNLNQTYILDGAKLTLESDTWDYPRNLQAAVSMDGETWTYLDTCTEDNTSYYFEESSCRYIRFVLGDAEDTGSHWSVYEISLFSPLFP